MYVEASVATTRSAVIMPRIFKPSTVEVIRLLCDTGLSSQSHGVPVTSVWAR